MSGMRALAYWYNANTGRVRRRDAVLMLWHRWRLNRTNDSDRWDAHLAAIRRTLQKDPVVNADELARWDEYEAECIRLAENEP